MKQIELTLLNPTGLHARPAKVFVNTAKEFKAKIRVHHGDKNSSGKSVISILSLGVQQGGRIIITADGPDEDEALAVLKAGVESGLGDDLSVAHSDTVETDQAPSSEPSAAPEAKPIVDGVAQGIPAASGLAIGRLYAFRREAVDFSSVTAETAGSPDEERARLKTALGEARHELQALHRRMLDRVGAAEAGIFEAHLAILEDQELFAKAVDQLEMEQSALQAWQSTIETTAATIAGLGDELLAARATDIRDVGQRVLRRLMGVETQSLQLPAEPVILIAEDLTPSDTVSLDPKRVLGFCTATGGPNGHTAILARALGLPAIVGAGPAILEVVAGQMAILNGDTGELTIDPDETTLTSARQQQQQYQEQQATYLAAAQSPATTQDGHQVEVVANLGNVDEARQAISFGAEGVGLLRTEFLFLDRVEPPTEDEQFEVYRDIALALEGQPVLIRTLDVGGDKPLPYLTLPVEENPFLGQRGVRLCLARPELFRTQLRAILRAAEYGHLRVMFPMVTTLEDWRKAKQMVLDLQAELNTKPVELGIMIEVPAAALLADAFAREVDFFSIGTNDLTQYAMAIDRTHPILAEQADGLHPAVLSLIERTAQAAHTHGKWVGVCGELAADPLAIPILLGLGIDELSASVPAIPTVKAHIRNLSFTTAQEIATAALRSEAAQDVRSLVENSRVKEVA